MTAEARQIATVRDPQEAQSAFRERAEELKIPREVLDELTGLPKGYSGKVLANPPAKGLGHVSFWTLLGALGLAVMLVEDERRMVRVNATAKRQGSYPEKRNWRNAKALRIIEEMNRKSGKIGQKARMKATTKKQRSRWARKAAKARWRKPRIEEITKSAIAMPPQPGALTKSHF